MSDDVHQLADLLALLVDSGRSARELWPFTDNELARLGFEPAGDEVILPSSVELLAPELVRAALSPAAQAWLRDFKLHRVIDSTNRELRNLANQQSVAGVLSLAELQVRGRGRHGRHWHSPFGRNLALSFGVAIDMPMSELGGLSLAVGLAIVDVLESLNFQGVALKWPNDLLLDGGKLGGILIELIPRGKTVELVVGIGLNLELSSDIRSSIDQPVSSLTDVLDDPQGVPSRNQLAGQIVSAALDFIEQYRRVGFAPMRSLFNAHHHFHEQFCQLLQGERRVFGQVRGVTELGELLMDTDHGLRTFSAGEVSLRKQ